jgi:hypothetical protein
MGYGKRTAALASVLFAVAACHAETISWISGRVDSIAALFYLGAFLLFALFRTRGSYRWYISSLVVFALGLYAKQTLMVVPVLLATFDIVYGRTKRNLRSWLPHLPFAAVLLLHVVLRRVLFGQAVREDQFKLDMFKEFALRQSDYLRYLFLPITDAPFDRLTKILITVGMLALYAACAFLAAKALQSETLRTVFFFGIVWYLISVSPLIVTYESARHLYIPSAGFSIALAALLLPAQRALSSRLTFLRTATIAGIVVLNAVALHAQTVTWSKNGSQSLALTSRTSVLLQSVPRGSMLVVDVPRTSHGLWLWSFAFPFILQRPFFGEELYSQFRVIESPGVYCCVLDQWWEAKRSMLEPVLRMPPEQVMTIYSLHGDGDEAPLALTTKSIAAGELRHRFAAVFGVEGLKESGISSEQARGLLDVLQQ